MGLRITKRHRNASLCFIYQRFCKENSVYFHAVDANSIFISNLGSSSIPINTDYVSVQN